MIKIQKKHVIIGLIGFVTITGAVATYIQYEKLMNYVIAFSRIKIKSLTSKFVSFDLFVNYTNKSNITINIKSQEYRIYINDVYVSKASNDVLSVIEANSTSELGINIAFNPAIVINTLKKSWSDILLYPEKVKIRIDSKLKLSLWNFIPISVPYSYETTLKELKS